MRAFCRISRACRACLRSKNHKWKQNRPNYIDNTIGRHSKTSLLPSSLAINSFYRCRQSLLSAPIVESSSTCASNATLLIGQPGKCRHTPHLHNDPLSRVFFSVSLYLLFTELTGNWGKNLGFKMQYLSIMQPDTRREGMFCFLQHRWDERLQKTTWV